MVQEEDTLSFLQEQVDKEKRTIGKTILTHSVTGERWSLPKRKISIRGIIDRITYRVEKET